MRTDPARRPASGLFAATACAAAALWAAALSAEDPPGPDERDPLNEKMRERAASVRVVAPGEGGSAGEPAELVAKPLLRYGDVPRGIDGATLWAWGTDGRPLALAKLEAVRSETGGQWQYCLASLSDGLIEARWDDGSTFRSAAPGLTLIGLKDPHEAPDRPAARMLRMKEIARRFSAEILVDGQSGMRQEMRLLPRPVHRYDGGDVVDGAIFGFATNGTNPDLLLLVELRRDDGPEPRWMYGFAGMTTGELHVRVGRDEVWSRPSGFGDGRWGLVHQPQDVAAE